MFNSIHDSRLVLSDKKGGGLNYSLEEGGIHGPEDKVARL